MPNKPPIFIVFGNDIARIERGNAGAYSQPTLEVISPSFTGDNGAFTPAQSMKLYGLDSLAHLAKALDEVIREYDVERGIQEAQGD